MKRQAQITLLEKLTWSGFVFTRVQGETTFSGTFFNHAVWLEERENDWQIRYALEYPRYEFKEIDGEDYGTLLQQAFNDHHAEAHAVKRT